VSAVHSFPPPFMTTRNLKGRRLFCGFRLPPQRSSPDPLETLCFRFKAFASRLLIFPRQQLLSHSLYPFSYSFLSPIILQPSSACRCRWRLIFSASPLCLRTQYGFIDPRKVLVLPDPPGVRPTSLKIPPVSIRFLFWLSRPTSSVTMLHT